MIHYSMKRHLLYLYNYTYYIDYSIHYFKFTVLINTEAVIWANSTNDLFGT